MRVLVLEHGSYIANAIQVGFAAHQMHEVEVVALESVAQMGAASGDMLFVDLAVVEGQPAALAGLLQQGTPVPTVVVLDEESDTLCQQALKAGAWDCLFKLETSPALLVRVIDCAFLQQKMQIRPPLTEMDCLQLIEHNADGIVVVDEDGQICFVNRAGSRLFGRDTSALLGEVYGFPLVAGETTEVDILQPDNGVIVAEMRVVQTMWAGKVAYLASLRDVTQRRYAERAMQESQAAYRELVEAIDGIVWEADPQTFAFTYVSQQAERLLGYSPEAWIADPDFWWKHVHPDDREEAMAYSKASTAELRDHELEYRMIAADGRIVWLRDLVSIEGEAGYPVRMRGIMVEVTERRITENALREAQQLNRAILNSLSASIAVVNEQGMVIAVNDTWLDEANRHENPLLTGTNVGTDYFAVARQASLDLDVPDLVYQMMLVLSGTVDSYDHDYHLLPPGEDIWYQVSILPLSEREQRHIVIAHLDVSTRRRAAQARAEAEADIRRVEQQRSELLLFERLTKSAYLATRQRPEKLVLPTLPAGVVEQLSQQYAAILDKGVERRAYKVKYNISRDLHDLAQRLGTLDTGPRDVVELHLAVLRRKTQGISSLKAEAYVEEGRVTVLELMGYLASYYRGRVLSDFTGLSNGGGDAGEEYG